MLQAVKMKAAGGAAAMVSAAVEPARAVQDEALAKRLLQRQDELAAERLPWESAWRDIDRLVNPVAGGGFTPQSPGHRGLDNFDATAIEGLDRFTSCLASITIPKGSRWHGLATIDNELNKSAAVARWCEHATDRLFAMRYAPRAGFTTQAHEDIRQTGSYGTAPFWTHEVPGQSLFYKALHLSEVFIDEDYTGRVDTVHRRFELSVRQIEQQFGRNALSPKMREKLTGANQQPEAKFELLHVVRPNADRQPDRLDWRAKPIESLYIGIDEKWILQRGGYWSMPIAVSRHVTSPRDKYGRSPAMKVIGTIKAVNEMAKTMIRAGHKAVDPPLLFADDDAITKLVTRPGGMNPGLIDDMGRVLARPLETGGNLPIGRELMMDERAVIQRSFLEEYFNILTDPSDRMTATQVLETVQKQGVLVAPFADRYESEKTSMIVMRELDLGLRSGQIDPPPPEMLEAGSPLRVVMTNPLARMARAEEAAGFARWAEMAVQMAPFDEEVFDLVDTDTALRGVGEVLGVRPSWIRSPEAVADRRKAREESKAGAEMAAALPDAAGAALDLARANQIAAAA